MNKYKSIITYNIISQLETEDDLKLFEIINKMLNILYKEQLDDFKIE